jgi:hypothetical protein
MTSDLDSQLSARSVGLKIGDRVSFNNEFGPTEGTVTRIGPRITVRGNLGYSWIMDAPEVMLVSSGEPSVQSGNLIPLTQRT